MSTAILAKFLKLKYIFQSGGVLGVYNTVINKLCRVVIREKSIILKYQRSLLGIELSREIYYLKCKSISDVPEKLISQIYEEMGPFASEDMFSQFNIGSVFWVICNDDELVGYWWSIEGEFLEAWFIPLDNKDVVFLSALIVPKWRGFSISPSVLLHIIHNEISCNVSIFIDVKNWNLSALNAWKKAGFCIVEITKQQLQSRKKELM